MSTAAMGTILIDKLLHAVRSSKARAIIHITVGQPPVFRLDGRMRQARDEGARCRMDTMSP